jgi:hypothetical protein
MMILAIFVFQQILVSRFVSHFSDPTVLKILIQVIVVMCLGKLNKWLPPPKRQALTLGFVLDSQFFEYMSKKLFQPLFDRNC